MMGCRGYFIFTLRIAYFGLTCVQSYSLIADQTVHPQKMRADGTVRENFRNFFDSIVKNNGRRGGIYAGMLKQEAARDEEAFDTLKSKLEFARIHNVHGRRHSSEANRMGKNVKAKKRETNENNAAGISTNSPAETSDSWLEKDKFEQMIAHQPEALLAQMQKLFNEHQSLQKKVQLHEDTRKNDLLKREEALAAVALKLRAFENWELSMFGRVLTGPLRLHVMRKFLKGLAKGDEWAVATAEKFRAAWAILSASDVSLAAEIAQTYSNEIQSLGESIYKWCGNRTLDLSSVNTTYLDLAIDAGLVQVVTSQKYNPCEGYAEWRVTFSPQFATESTPRMRTVEFYSEKEKYRAMEMLASTNVSSTVAPCAPKTVTMAPRKPPKTTKKASFEEDYYMDSAGDGPSDDADSVETITRDPRVYRLPNWIGQTRPLRRFSSGPRVEGPLRVRFF